LDTPSYIPLSCYVWFPVDGAIKFRNCYKETNVALRRSLCTQNFVFVLRSPQSSVRTLFNWIWGAIKVHLEYWLTKLVVVVLEGWPFSLIGYWKTSKEHLTDSIGCGIGAIRWSPWHDMPQFTLMRHFSGTETDCLSFVKFSLQNLCRVIRKRFQASFKKEQNNLCLYASTGRFKQQQKRHY